MPRTVDFSDGYSTSSAPSAGSISQNSLAVYATDAAYVTGKGSAAANGDAYYNSTYHAVRVYQNGAWHFVKVALSFALEADFVTAKGSAAADGDFFYDTATDTLKVYQNGAWMKVQSTTDGFTADTAPALADHVPTYDASASGPKKVLLGALIQAALDARGMFNLGLANATTTNASDSIKVQGADAALSATNPLYVNLPTVSSPGRMTRFSATADVTINLTGAHWGLGTNGDFTDIILRVYAINDNGTLKWGVSNKGGLRSIADTAASTTATNINTQPEMLVNSALSSGTWPCREVGWFLGDFDDTGGAAEDLWAVQTGAGEIMVGVPAPVSTDWEDITITCGVTGGTTVVTAKSRHDGPNLEVNLNAVFSTVFTGGTMTFSLPSGTRIDTTKLPTSVGAQEIPGGKITLLDAGTQAYMGTLFYNNISSVLARALIEDLGSGSSYVGDGGISTTAPFTWANNDSAGVSFVVPILGWSGN
jgi:hypothetical protein